jgi:hypothetical protein
VRRIENDEALIGAILDAQGKTCATCTATWRRVKRRDEANALLFRTG